MLVRCPINSLGYGHASIGIISGLLEIGQSPIVSPINRAIGDIPHSIAECIHKFPNSYKSDLDCLTIWHEFELINQSIGRGRHLALSFFEVNTLNPIRQYNLNAMDIIFSPSNWGKEVMENSGVTKPIRVIPMGVDRNLFYQQATKIDEIYRFYTVGKGEYRKGTEILVDTFNRVFKGVNNVQLNVLGYSGLPKCDEIINGLRSKRYPNVYFDPPLRHDYEYASYIRAMDCGVFPTRAEGFGFPIAQSIACGNPVITTDYSAHAEYCNTTNSFLIEISDFEVADDQTWFHGLGTWAKIGKKEISQLEDYMLYCFNNRPQGGKLDDRYTWKKCAEEITKETQS